MFKKWGFQIYLKINTDNRILTVWRDFVKQINTVLLEMAEGWLGVVHSLFPFKNSAKLSVFPK